MFWLPNSSILLGRSWKHNQRFTGGLADHERGHPKPLAYQDANHVDRYHLYHEQIALDTDFSLYSFCCINHLQSHHWSGVRWSPKDHLYPNPWYWLVKVPEYPMWVIYSVIRHSRGTWHTPYTPYCFAISSNQPLWKYESNWKSSPSRCELRKPCAATTYLGVV